MSIRTPADALTKAGDIRSATDRIRVPATKDFSGLGYEALLTLPGVSSDEGRAAGRVVVRIADRVSATKEDTLAVLRALGLAPDPGKAVSA